MCQRAIQLKYDVEEISGTDDERFGIEECVYELSPIHLNPFLRGERLVVGKLLVQEGNYRVPVDGRLSDEIIPETFKEKDANYWKIQVLILTYYRFLLKNKCE